MLEQVGDEAVEILPLLGELLDELEQARRVSIDDQVAETKQRVLLDGAEELQDILDDDRPFGRGGELIERRDGIAEAPACAARDDRQRGVGHVHPLAVGDSAQEPRELGKPRPREEERLAA